MKKILIILVLLISYCTQAQDIVVLKHTNYTAHFSKSLRYPVMVEWWETKANCGCSDPIPRVDNFQPDPKAKKDTELLTDYFRSGLDRGHMCPARVNRCQGTKILDECFYFSNMTPQYHALNAGDWEELEATTYNIAREKDSVHIWAGSLGVAKKIGTTSVPRKCWKVVYIKATKELKAYIFVNNLAKEDGIKDNEVSIDVITKLTGFRYWNNIEK